MYAIGLIGESHPLTGAVKQMRLVGARWRSAALVALLAASLAGCQDDQVAMSGNAKHGLALIKQNGCGTCHVIPGVDGAEGLVGPPLNTMGRRIYIAGVRRNTPENMTAWLQNPQAVVPGNVMPNMGLSRQDAVDVGAYLHTLR